MQEQLLQQEQQLHIQIMQQLKQLPQYKDILRIETAQQQILQKQDQQHKQLMQRLMQLEQQHQHADESKIQEMMHELHQMMQQQQQLQAHAAAAQGHSDVSELKVMIQQLQHKLQLRSMARNPSSAAPSSQELRGMRTFTTSDIKIIERIGEGGNSDVYLAQCRIFPGHVVYKKWHTPEALFPPLHYLPLHLTRRLLQ